MLHLKYKVGITISKKRRLVLKILLVSIIVLMFVGTYNSIQSSCESINQDVVKDSAFTLKEIISIQPNEEHNYEITIEFIEQEIYKTIILMYS